MSSFALRLVQPPAPPPPEAPLESPAPAPEVTNEAALESRQNMAIGESQRVHSQWYERHQWLWRINESGQFASLSPAAKVALIQLWLHANDRGSAWPAVSRVASRAGLTERSVRRGLKELVAAGVVTQQTTGSGRMSARYQIDFSTNFSSCGKLGNLKKTHHTKIKSDTNATPGWTQAPPEQS